MLVATAALSGAILLIIGTATGMAWALTQSGFSAALAAFMTGLPGGIPTFPAVTMVAFVVLGSVLEGIPAIVLFGPLLFPIARQVGVHEVHQALVVILAMGKRPGRPISTAGVSRPCRASTPVAASRASAGRTGSTACTRSPRRTRCISRGGAPHTPAVRSARRGTAGR